MFYAYNEKVETFIGKSHGERKNKRILDSCESADR